MPTYYTQSGQKIRNSEAYAMTGARIDLFGDLHGRRLLGLVLVLLLVLLGLLFLLVFGLLPGLLLLGRHIFPWLLLCLL